MNGLWDILSVAIGVSFVFMILSILNSWIQDYVATIFHIRANNLADIMQVLLEPGALKLNGPGRAKAPPETIEYKTQEKSEETLSQIAGYFKVSVENLRNANLNILDDLPLSGDRSGLRIPKLWVDQYKVQDNETIKDIAKKFGGSVEAFRKENLNVLFELPLPKDKVIAIPEHSYKVQEKETLSSIAEKLQAPVQELQRKNHEALDHLSLLKDEELEIQIPEYSYEMRDKETMSSVAQNIEVPIKKLEEKNPKKPDDKKITIPEHQHKVQPKETISSIAEKLRVPIEKLREKNLEVLYKLPLTEEMFDAKVLNDALGRFGKREIMIPAHSYKTQDKETTGSIAEKLQVPVEKLQEKNPEALDNLSLQKDSEIKIPIDSYKAQDNETMKDIAKKFGRSVEALRKENINSIDTTALNTKVKLTIPKPKAGQYTVQPTDTMASIAKKFGMSIEDLQKENKDLRKKNPQVPIVTLQEPPITSLRIPKPKLGQMTSRKNLKPQLIANPVGSIYSHPVIHSLSRPDELPDRIPTKDFTVALLDILDDVGRGKEGVGSGKGEEKKININTIIEGIKSLEGEGDNENTHPLAFRLRSLLYTAQINTQINTKADEADASLEEFQKAVSDWFDDTVARGSLWYKRKMQRIGILFGILLAVVLNADTIGISNVLWHNAALRESISRAAEASTQQGEAPNSEQAQAQLDELMKLGLPIGWSLDGNPGDPRAIPYTTEGWISKTIGLLLTGFAISQGSQLWFDLINRLINIRSSVSKSDTDEASSKSQGN